MSACPPDFPDSALALNGQALSGCFDSHAAADLLSRRPGLLADSRVFLSQANHNAMAQAIAAIEGVIATAGWQEKVLANAGETARHLSPVRGVFYGYDFHITPDGPRLIEINTNAGGAFINAKLLAWQTSAGSPEAAAAVEQDFLAMFQEEWRLAGHTSPLQRVAIVDETPGEQYLGPDFEYCRELLAAAGIDASICAPEDLHWENGVLSLAGQPVDLVYNRLTDFALTQPGNDALRQTWLADGAVVTPHPRAHALYADKHNLVLLSDPAWLQTLGVSEADRQCIAAVLPPTELVKADQGDDLWARRKGLFFKPLSGYGGKAVYRGANVTKRVFADILAGDYVAQVLAPPPARTVLVEGAPVELKYDLRCYAYGGRIQLMAARLWQGQTTNFRTPGGGFAPVVVLPI
jgi:hypothetical protein